MFFANDKNNCRKRADETYSNQEYYCPFCGAPLTVRKGDERRHHFAHRPGHICKDSWERNNSYNTSPWHNDWQNCFPMDNQEVKLTFGETVHRADVMVGRTVVEFQRSNMAANAFEDRNNFYGNLGCKVVWLFDLRDVFQQGLLQYKEQGDTLFFTWKYPRKAFNSYDIKNGNIDLFFQLTDDADASIVQVTNVSENGFEKFETLRRIGKTDFLRYAGNEDGDCEKPFIYDIEKNSKQYKAFCDRYHISLNKQQERAVLSVDGAVLLLAVPGSGKTTVLIDRIGHMVLNRHIDPKSILALTYGKAATEEMRARFSERFGTQIGNQIDFRTINSISLEIYKTYCYTNGCERYRQDTDARKHILLSACRNFNSDNGNDYISENEIQVLEQAIGQIKNLMLSEKEIDDLEKEIPHLHKKYDYYQKALAERKLMDFDDQMIFALEILRKDRNTLAYWRKKYQYFCVDEAQDTSKIQHEIIKLLAKGNHIFMVGDEDQSIYGFRGAYPRALLNFRYDYKNPYILRMEQNYRSTTPIVDLAQQFISKNKGRYNKTMVSARGEGKDVEVLSCGSREEQYAQLLQASRNRQDATAFLFRDNESAVVLVDLFLRNGIDYRMKKPQMNFFALRTTKDIIAHLCLTVNEYDTDALGQICNRGILFLKKQQLQYAIQNCKSRKISVFESLKEQMKYVKYERKSDADNFRVLIEELRKQSPINAIQTIMNAGYAKYLRKFDYGSGAVDTLQMLAKQEQSIPSLLHRLQVLEKAIQKDTDGMSKNPVTLSTIHSSKGLEYDAVYMVDVYDGKFPASSPNPYSQAKDNYDGEQEERRLFYVGITRAANRLVLFDIKDRPSTFLEELFPAIKATREQEKAQALLQKQQRERAEYERILEKRRQQERELAESRQRLWEKWRIEEEERQAKEEAQQKAVELQRKRREEAELQKGYLEVATMFDQQATPVRDSFGRRWVKCEKCGEKKLETEFVSYGGRNHVNLGLCRECARNRK